MLKLGLQVTEDEGNINIKLIDPTKKQLETATENEKITAQIIQEVLNKRLIEMMNSYETEEKEN